MNKGKTDKTFRMGVTLWPPMWNLHGKKFSTYHSFFKEIETTQHRSLLSASMASASYAEGKHTE